VGVQSDAIDPSFHVEGPVQPLAQRLAVVGVDAQTSRSGLQHAHSALREQLLQYLGRALLGGMVDVRAD
jgi:hypothetical protein